MSLLFRLSRMRRSRVSRRKSRRSSFSRRRYRARGGADEPAASGPSTGLLGGLFGTASAASSGASNTTSVASSGASNTTSVASSGASNTASAASSGASNTASSASSGASNTANTSSPSLRDLLDALRTKARTIPFTEISRSSEYTAITNFIRSRPKFQRIPLSAQVSALLRTMDRKAATALPPLPSSASSALPASLTNGQAQQLGQAIYSQVRSIIGLSSSTASNQQGSTASSAASGAGGVLSVLGL